MPHVRTQIRQAFAAALTGLATTGDRVHQSRGLALATAACPALILHMAGEEITADDRRWPARLDRHFRALVEIKVWGDDLDGQLEAITAEVESAVMGTQGDSMLGGLVKRGLFLAEIGDPVIDDSADPAVATQTLTFKGRYRTDAPDPTTQIL